MNITDTTESHTVFRLENPLQERFMSRRFPRSILAVSVLLVATATARGQDVPAVSVSGTEVTKRTEKLMNRYQWGETLGSVLAKAKENKRLVFWVDIVGDLDGGL